MKYDDLWYVSVESFSLSAYKNLEQQQQQRKHGLYVSTRNLIPTINVIKIDCILENPGIKNY